MIVSILLVIALIFYVSIVLRLRMVWLNTIETPLSEFIPDVCILVIFRNEAENLPNLLHDIDLLERDGNAMEVVLIDDGSTDSSVAVINRWKRDKDFRVVIEPLFARTKAHKKEGIELGVANARYEHILVTDADCRLPKEWLRSMVTMNKQRLRCGPVAYMPSKALFSKILELELMGLSALAAGTLGSYKPLLANAANMSYTRTLFLTLGGYKTNEIKQSPSGDDISLLKQVHNHYPTGAHFIKNKTALVRTEMPRSFQEFIQQRLRWAGKTKHEKNLPGSWIGLGLLLLYVMLFLAPFVMFFAFSWMAIWTWLACFGIKFIVDMLFLKPFLSYFGKEKLISSLLAVEIFQILYVVPVGILSMILPFTWKGRRLRHG